MAIKRLFCDLLNLILPTQCKICNQPLERFEEKFICSDCWTKVELYSSPQCYQCGKGLADSLKHIQQPICRECKTEKRYFYQARPVGHYRGVLKESILLFKFGKKTALRKAMGNLLIDYLKTQIEMVKEIDLILPVPLHWWRKYQRGFNQSELLSVSISRYFQLRLLNNVLCRIKATIPQSALKRNKRLNNIKDAFVVKQPNKVADKTILLIDDVYTTGATVNECAKVLTKAGAKRVYVLTLSRGL